MRLSLCIVAVLCLAATLSSARTARLPAETPSRPEIVRDGRAPLLSSSTHAALLHRESAGPDTFDLYGGPQRLVRDPDGVPGSGDEYVEGKFEDPSGTCPRGLSSSPGDWTGVDLTDQPIHGRNATFNADNLNGRGTGNRAWWFGAPDGEPDTAGWATPPGYGNDWIEAILFEAPVTDPSQGQTVGLDFFFNFDTEPLYDFVYVQFDSANAWVTVWSGDGSNRDEGTGDFEAPGLQFATLPDVGSIVYAGDDYPDGKIRLRILFESDALYSDEDGLFPSDGAVQIDDVTITTVDGVFTEDFEAGDSGIFEPQRAPFAGDFSTVFPIFLDIDPCAENTTPLVGFIDFGQEPLNGPAPDGTTSTGGTTSPTWNYGISGGWVVNRTGGLSGSGKLLDNEVWSPVFDWDLPGGDDDDPTFVGAQLSYSVWRHNPLANGIFYKWHVRAESGGVWGPWKDENIVYFSSVAQWRHETHDVTGLLPPGPERVQIALGVVNLAALFGLPGTDSTPAPLFDDVRLRKYRVGGAVLSADDSWLPQDAFPASGEIASATATERDLLDVRFDMGRDVAPSSSSIVSGDSIVVQVDTPIPGTSLLDLRLHWVLRQNQEFEGALRTAPSGPVDLNVDAEEVDGVTYWSGEVVAQQCTIAGGTPVEGRWFADLPDEDFLYPGDVLHVYWEAIDSDGRVTTLPSDLGGFGEWNAVGQSTYDRRFTMRALPTLYEEFFLIARENEKRIDIPDAPNLLVVDDTGDPAELQRFLTAMRWLYYREGLHYDVFTIRGAEASHSNGIGAAATPTPLGDRRGPGATTAQLQFYDGIFYLAAERDDALLSDGTDEGSNDKGDDLGRLTEFMGLPGLRVVFVMGDNVASGLQVESAVAGPRFVAELVAVEVLDTDVSRLFGGTRNLEIEGVLVADDFAAVGACPTPARFDALEALPLAQTGWRYVDPGSGTPVFGVAAGVVHDRAGPLPLDRRMNVTLPFAPSRIGGTGNDLAELLDTLFDLSNVLTPPPNDAPAAPREASFAVYPNPFNPRTTVAFALPRADVRAAVVVYDLRGRRVRTLHDGIAETADLELTWNGTDDRGARVSSGVYLIRATTEEFRRAVKVALVE